MKSPVWSKALKDCADPENARHHFKLLLATSAAEVLARASAEQARILSALFSGSQALSKYLIAHPELISSLSPDLLKHPRRAQGLRHELVDCFKPVADTAARETALAKLRQFKQREMLRIGTRDLARLAEVREITLELSNLADVCLETVLRVCESEMITRLGRRVTAIRKAAGSRPSFCVLGLGKLGGQELNYSSDVDVMFVYRRKGWCSSNSRSRTGTPPAPVLPIINISTAWPRCSSPKSARITGDGTLYRMDLRLRPEGDAGPLTRSLASYENYYAQWGQTWERMMLIKARGVAGDGALAAEFLEMIQHVPLSAFPRRRRPARSRRHEGPHRKRSRQGGRTGPQRQTWPRRHPGNRIRGANAATDCTRADCRFCKGRKPCRRWKNSRNTSCSLPRRRVALSRGLLFSPRRRAPTANGGQSSRRTPFPMHAAARERLAAPDGIPRADTDFEAARETPTPACAARLSIAC